jgi:hypothetical protein
MVMLIKEAGTQAGRYYDALFLSDTPAPSQNVPRADTSDQK